VVDDGIFSSGLRPPPEIALLGDAEVAALCETTWLGRSAVAGWTRLLHGRCSARSPCTGVVPTHARMGLLGSWRQAAFVAGGHMAGRCQGKHSNAGSWDGAALDLSSCRKSGTLQRRWRKRSAPVRRHRHHRSAGNEERHGRRRCFYLYTLMLRLKKTSVLLQARARSGSCVE
jgi:hypothetical protein